MLADSDRSRGTEGDQPEEAGAAVLPVLLALDAGLLGASSDVVLEVWPGRVVLIVRPQHRMDQDRLRGFEERMAVIEVLDGPWGMARLVAALARIGRSAPCLRGEALLYLNRAIEPRELIGIAGALREDPSLVRLEQDEGETRLLVLGPGILRNPALPVLRNVFREWEITDELFCDLLREWLPEGLA